jgi:hypothetical protein
MENNRIHALEIYSDYEKEVKGLQEKYNKIFLEMNPVFPYFKEGDIIKCKNRNYNTYSLRHSAEIGVYKITKVIPPNIFNWDGSLTRDEDIQYKYSGHILLKNYIFSKKEDEIRFFQLDQVELFNGGDKIKLNNDTIENWEACTVNEINFLRLCEDVNNILNKLNNVKVSEQLIKYSKQSHISKSVLEKNPELLYVHEKIETLKKFKTHIQTNH